MDQIFLESLALSSSGIDSEPVFVSLPGPIDVFCKAPRMVMPEIGDIVSILIVGKDEENLLLWGSIKHTEKQSVR